MAAFDASALYTSMRQSLDRRVQELADHVPGFADVRPCSVCGDERATGWVAEGDGQHLVLVQRDRPSVSTPVFEQEATANSYRVILHLDLHLALCAAVSKVASSG